MKVRQMFVVATIVCMLLLTAVQTAEAGNRSPYSGTWEGSMNGLPGVKLTIADADGGEIGGVVVFYFQLRGDDGKWRVAGKYAAPLLQVSLKGTDLLFQVQHHRTHTSPEFGPNRRFRMELKGGDDAVLLSDDDEQSVGPVKLERRKEESDNQNSHRVHAGPGRPSWELGLLWIAGPI